MRCIERLLRRSVHLFSRISSNFPYEASRFPSESLQVRSAVRTSSILIPIQSLSFLAAAVSGEPSVRTDEENDVAFSTEQLLRGREEINVVNDEETEMHEEGRITVVEECKQVWMELTESSTRGLIYGVGIVNVLIQTAFQVAYYKSSTPKPRPELLRFMSKNFVLSDGWLRRGHWHVLLTNIFTHVRPSHLIFNTLATWLGILACSRFLTGWEIASLFVAGGVTGGAASIGLARVLRKQKYQGAYVGGSDGQAALIYFYSSEKGLSKSDSWAHLLKIAVIVDLVGEVAGVRRYLRYGVHGKGKTSVRIGHVAHLAGTCTGLAAYGMKRVHGSTRQTSDDNAQIS